MMTKILKVVSQSAVTYIPSQKTEGGRLAKCEIRLRELGGKYADEFACSVYGNAALCKYYEGDIVLASLRFQVNEVNAMLFENIVLTELLKLNK